MKPSEERCELCGMERPTWFFPSRDVSQRVTALADVILSVGAWTVCGTCRQLAEDRDWQVLLERQVEGIRQVVERDGPALLPDQERRLREAAVTVQTLLRTAITGPARPRAKAPEPPGAGGDLDAYREGWTQVWRQAPGNLIGDADGRAAQLAEALRSWGVDTGHPQVRRALWGIMAILQAEQADAEVTASFSAVLSSLEVGT